MCRYHALGEINFEQLLNNTKFALYSHFSDGIGTKRNQVFSAIYHDSDKLLLMRTETVTFYPASYPSRLTKPAFFFVLQKSLKL